jgi:hypothetical protein
MNKLLVLLVFTLLLSLRSLSAADDEALWYWAIDSQSGEYVAFNAAGDFNRIDYITPQPTYILRLDRGTALSFAWHDGSLHIHRLDTTTARALLRIGPGA